MNNKKYILITLFAGTFAVLGLLNAEDTKKINTNKSMASFQSALSESKVTIIKSKKNSTLKHITQDVKRSNVSNVLQNKKPLKLSVTPALFNLVIQELDEELTKTKTLVKKINSPIKSLSVTNSKKLKEALRFEDLWDVPAALYMQAGEEKANSIWQEIMNEPMDTKQVNSLILPISFQSNSLMANSLVAMRGEPRFVTWQIRTDCQVGDLTSERNLVGFIIKIFDENQKFIKQTFIKTEKGDGAGCLLYKKPLAMFLPQELTEQDFDGFISITGIKADRFESTGVVWNNFVRPKGISVNDHGLLSIILEWDANPEKDIGGYFIYYGQKSGIYSHVIDVGNNSSAKLSGLAHGNWYIAVAAYNTSGLKSEKSVEILYEDKAKVEEKK